MSELVRLLMRIIGASAAPEDAQQEANQESPACIARKSYSRAFQALDADASGLSEIQTADVTSDGAAAHHEEGTADMPVEAEMFSVAELTEMARMMLNMILELYGEMTC